MYQSEVYLIDLVQIHYLQNLVAVFVAHDALSDEWVCQIPFFPPFQDRKVQSSKFLSYFKQHLREIGFRCMWAGFYERSGTKAYFIWHWRVLAIEDHVHQQLGDACAGSSQVRKYGRFCLKKSQGKLHQKLQQCVSGGRCSPSLSSFGRVWHEHRHSGCTQSGVEIGPRIKRQC